MKKLMIITLILTMLCTAAIADRTVSGDTCATMDEFIACLQMGTVADFDCYRRPGFGDNAMQTTAIMSNVGWHIVYVYVDEDEIKQFEVDDIIHVTGKLVSRGNSGHAYYFDTRGDLGSVGPAHHQPVTYQADGAFTRAAIRGMWRSDIITGTGKITASKESKGIDGKPYYQYAVQCGENLFGFSRKDHDYFRGDTITFTANPSNTQTIDVIMSLNIIDISLVQ